MAAPPLPHLRVVDLTDLRGALAGRILADLGADVIKVEPPGGDPDRMRPPFAGGVAAPDRSLPFLFRHANKRGAVIDMERPGGRERLFVLCQRADVLLENLDLRERERRGFTPAEVRARHPHLVHVAMTDFGLSGPRAGWRLEALPAFAASGALYSSGFPHRPPCWLPGYLAHDCAAIAAVTGALVAVLDRARHGAGQTVEVAVQEAALASLDPWMILLTDYARVYGVLPTSYPRDADGPALVLPTADGWVRILAVTPRQWRAFVALVADWETATADPAETAYRVPGRGTWAHVGSGLAALASSGLRTAGRLAGLLARLPVHGGFLPAFEAALGLVRRIAGDALHDRSRAEVLAHARRLGLPIAPVNAPDAFVAEEQTRVRGYFHRTDFPHCANAPFAPFPCRLGRTPAVLARPAPAGDGRAEFAPRAAAPATGASNGPLLAGMRVVNLGVGAVVPELCRLLGELGADVVKIESRVSLDFAARPSRGARRTA